MMKRGESFSGVSGVQIEDAMIQESMGPLYDRTKENLGATDLAVVRMRRLMLASVRRFSESGENPLGLSEPIDYASLRAAELMLPLGSSWQNVMTAREPV
jgi:phthalate 4,5-dioxygenase